VCLGLRTRHLLLVADDSWAVPLRILHGLDVVVFSEDPVHRVIQRDSRVAEEVGAVMVVAEKSMRVMAQVASNNVIQPAFVEAVFEMEQARWWAGQLQVSILPIRSW
jgi:hypothetical protein